MKANDTGLVLKKKVCKTKMKIKYFSKNNSKRRKRFQMILITMFNKEGSLTISFNNFTSVIKHFKHNKSI